MATIPYNYNVNPLPQPGSGAYGAVPGSVGIPPNIYEQLGTVDPTIASQTGQAGTNIMSELQGELSPETLAALQNNAATFGVKSGMPGSQFQGYYGLSGLKDTVEARQRAGLQDYLAMMHGLGQTLTPQQLAAEIASNNATMGAAPDPRQAAEQQMRDWQDKFNQSVGSPGVHINPAAGGGAPAAIAPGLPARSTDPFGAAQAATFAETDRARAYAAQQARSGAFPTGYYPADTYTGNDLSYYDPTGAMNALFGQGAGYTYMGENPAMAGYYPPDTYTGDSLSYYDPLGTMSAFDTGTPANTYNTPDYSYYDPTGAMGALDTGNDYASFDPFFGSTDYSDYYGG